MAVLDSGSDLRQNVTGGSELAPSRSFPYELDQDNAPETVSGDPIRIGDLDANSKLIGESQLGFTTEILVSDASPRKSELAFGATGRDVTVIAQGGAGWSFESSALLLGATNQLGIVSDAVDTNENGLFGLLFEVEQNGANVLLQNTVFGLQPARVADARRMWSESGKADKFQVTVEHSDLLSTDAGIERVDTLDLALLDEGALVRFVATNGQSPQSLNLVEKWQGGLFLTSIDSINGRFIRIRQEIVSADGNLKLRQNKRPSISLAARRQDKHFPDNIEITDIELVDFTKWVSEPKINT